MVTRVPRVAVVDDDPYVLKSLRRLLRSAGFDVEAYASGSEFLDAVLNGQPDCVVLDLNMPETSGFDVQIRLSERGRDPPVIVVTGDDTPAACSRAIRLGARECFVKPVDEARLLAAINTALVCGPLPPAATEAS